MTDSPTTATLSASDGNCSKSVTINLVKLDSNEKSTILPLPGSPAELAIDPVRSILYVSNYSLNRIERFDYANTAQLASIPVGPGPQGLDLTPTSDRLLVRSSLSENLESVDLTLASPSVTQSYYLTPGLNGYDRELVPCSVACTTSNLVLVGYGIATLGTSFSSPGQVDLNTGIFQKRTDLCYFSVPTIVRSSRDRNRVGILETGLSGSALFSVDSNLLNPISVAPSLYFPTFLCMSVDGSQAMVGPALGLYQAGALLANALGSGNQFTWNGGGVAYRHSNSSTVEAFGLPSLGTAPG